MKHVQEPIQVRCTGARPIAFRRSGRRRSAYTIDQILRVWVVQTSWWAEEVRHVYYEVVAGGGVYLLCRRHRPVNEWLLLGIHD